MQHKFCPLTKEACREDCALYVKYEIEDCNQENYTGCAFAVNANATVAVANSASGIDDSLCGFVDTEDVLRDVYTALRNLA